MLIKEMTKKVHMLAREKGWWKNQQDPSTGELNKGAVFDLIPEKLALIHAEVSEALEEYRDWRLCTYWEIPEYGRITTDDLDRMEFKELSVLAHTIARTNEDVPEFFSNTVWVTREEEHLLEMKEALTAFIVTQYKPDGFDIECADVVIRIGDLVEALGLDLELAIKRKHLYNQKRSYRHGGKKC